MLSTSPLTHPATGWPLRVLMLSPEYEMQRVGGLGAHVCALAPRLADHLHLDLIVPWYGGPAALHGAQWQSIGRYGQVHSVGVSEPEAGEGYVRRVWEMNDQLNAYATTLIEGGAAYDIMHAHDWLTGFIANDLHQRYHIPLITTIHATEHGRVQGRTHVSGISQGIHEAERHLARASDQVIACSLFMREEITRVLEVDADKVVVIPNGVESKPPHVWRQDQGPAELRQRFDLPAAGPLIFFVGRLVWPKGPDLLVSAMPAVIAAFPTASAILAGQGPLRDRLQQQIQDMGLQDRVHLAGFIADDLRDDLYALADVAVFPSRYEPFGIVALEAMAAGAAVVVADVGGLREVVANGLTGLCAPAENVDGLAQAIIRTLADPEGAQRRAAQARVLARSQFSWDRITAQTLASYRSVLAF